MIEYYLICTLIIISILELLFTIFIDDCNKDNNSILYIIDNSENFNSQNYQAIPFSDVDDNEYAGDDIYMHNNIDFPQIYEYYQIKIAIFVYQRKMK